MYSVGESIELSQLVGIHTLRGVDFVENEHGHASSVRFDLGTVVYVASEDPQDGYRSCLGDLCVDSERIKNFIPPTRVFAKYIDDPGAFVGLELKTIEDEKVVLKVGTNHYDDYYPFFEAYFRPENLPCNSPEAIEKEPDPVRRIAKEYGGDWGAFQ